MVKKDLVKEKVSSVNSDWKNPYHAKRRNKVVKEVKSGEREPTLAKTIETAKNTSNPELLHLMNNFREGIQGISGSVQQFEKTMESLTQLYQTFDNIGGIKRLNQFLSPSGSARGLANSTKDTGNLFGHLKTFIGMLEKVDFNQINQFLGSPTIQGMVNEEGSKVE